MNEQKTKGIILTKTSFGENDLIFDLLAEDGERVSFFVRGGKKIKSKFAGVIQIGNFVKVSFNKGKNFNYPKELEIDSSKRFDFYSKKLEAMNFFADIILIAKSISKDYKTEFLYKEIANTFNSAQSGEDLLVLYNSFLNNILNELGFNTDLICSSSGKLIDEPEFYYHPETNKAFKTENKPRSLDLPYIKKDDIFIKNYLKKIFAGNISHYIRLKF